VGRWDREFLYVSGKLRGGKGEEWGREGGWQVKTVNPGQRGGRGGTLRFQLKKRPQGEGSEELVSPRIDSYLADLNGF